MNAKSWLGRLAILLLLGSTCAFAQPVPPTGSFSFEDGSLADWDRGGTNPPRVAVLQNGNFFEQQCAWIFCNWVAVPMPAVPDGARFAALSTGPGGISNAQSFIDDNTVAERDVVTLSRNFTQQSGSAVLLFSWNFPSSEQDQQPTFDDLFDVSVDNQVIFARSAPKTPGSTSNYPDTPFTGYGSVVDWNIRDQAPLTNTVLRYGVGSWQRACVPIPAPSVLPANRTLRFRAADQGDNTFDSVLMLDDIRIADVCDTIPSGDLEQLTDTDGETITVSVKDGLGFGGSKRDQLNFANSADGEIIALASTANFTGDNPNVLPQVFLRSAVSGYQRVAALGLQARATIDSLALSGDGRWLAVSADRSGSDNLEIYLWDRNNPGALVTVTSTSGCSNTDPSLDRNGSLLAFESNCTGLTGANAGVSKVIYRSGTTLRALPNGSSCSASQPAVQQANGARYLVFASSCSPVGPASGNSEIYRFDIQANQVGSSSRYIRLSQPTGSGANCAFIATENSAPSLDEGGLATFVSSRNLTGQNADCSPEVYRYQFSPGSLAQITSAGFGEAWYLQAPLTASGGHYLFERLNVTSGLSQVGYRNAIEGLAGAESLAAEGVIEEVGVALKAGEVLLLLRSTEDFTGDNPDGNRELFRARIEP